MQEMLCWQGAETQGHVFPRQHKSGPSREAAAVCVQRCLWVIFSHERREKESRLAAVFLHSVVPFADAYIY